MQGCQPSTSCLLLVWTLFSSWYLHLSPGPSLTHSPLFLSSCPSSPGCKEKHVDIFPVSSVMGVEKCKVTRTSGCFPLNSYESVVLGTYLAPV